VEKAVGCEVGNFRHALKARDGPMTEDVDVVVRGKNYAKEREKLETQQLRVGNEREEGRYEVRMRRRD
jgi:hypothetical protein